MTLEEAKKFVIETLGPEKAELWWDSSIPLLGGLIPNKMIENGREARLLQWIKCQKDG